MFLKIQRKEQKPEEEQKKETGSGAPNPATLANRSLLRPAWSIWAI